jgi:hypothetical protein
MKISEEIVITHTQILRTHHKSFERITQILNNHQTLINNLMAQIEILDKRVSNLAISLERDGHKY